MRSHVLVWTATAVSLLVDVANFYVCRSTRTWPWQPWSCCWGFGSDSTWTQTLGTWDWSQGLVTWLQHNDLLKHRIELTVSERHGWTVVSIVILARRFSDGLHGWSLHIHPEPAWVLFHYLTQKHAQQADLLQMTCTGIDSGPTGWWQYQIPNSLSLV